MKLNLATIILIISIISLSSLKGCGQLVRSMGSSGNQETALKGDWKGSVKLYDVQGKAVQDKSGIKTTLLGSHHEGVSNAEGKWLLQDVETKTYTLKFSKSGYGSIKNQVSYVGGDTVIYSSIPSLYERPSFTVTTLSSKLNASSITVTGNTSTLPPSGSKWTVRLYIGKNKAISSKPKTYLYTLTDQTSTSASDFSRTISQSTLLKNGFKTGESIYIIAYGSSVYPGSEYSDPETGRKNYTSISSEASPIVTTTVP